VALVVERSLSKPAVCISHPVSDIFFKIPNAIKRQKY